MSASLRAPRAIDPLADAQTVLQALDQIGQGGQRGVLVCITHVSGSSVRRAGTLMAVAADGRYWGAFSSGCIESTVVAEALAVLAGSTRRELRLGAGSPYIDVRLPCGGGVDLAFVPDPPQSLIDSLLLPLQARQAAGLRLTTAQGECHFRYAPRLRVLIAGQGAEALALLPLVRSYGAETMLLTPQDSLAATTQDAGVTILRLESPRDVQHMPMDAWTAVALLFHDHGWEVDILRRALAGPAFWVGAMGGYKTRIARNEALRAVGCSDEAIARLHAPVGVIPAARDPQTLALSTMADIVAAYRARVELDASRPADRAG